MLWHLNIYLNIVRKKKKMNNKLKTLNEIIGCKNRIGKEGTICSNCGTNHLLSEELLKKGAIKWIKELYHIPNSVNANSLGNRIKVEADGKEIFDENEIENVMKIMMFDAPHVIKWIRYFFNIEDENLK